MNKCILVGCITLLISSCTISRLKEMQYCEIRFKSISQASINEVTIQDGERMKNLGMGQYLALLAALGNKNTVLRCSANISVTNRGKNKAGLDRFEWKAYMSNTLVAKDLYKKSFTVKPGTTSIVSVPVTVKTKDILGGSDAVSLSTMATSFIKNGQLKGLTIRIRPYTKVLFFHVKMPKKYEYTVER